MNSERRAYPRFLCTDAFSETTLLLENKSYQLVSINYNRKGIALYANFFLPEVKYGRLSFDYTSSEHPFKFDLIECEIRHRHETDVGNQYGIMFASTDKEICQSLYDLEKVLASASDDEDRYGFLKDT